MKLAKKIIPLILLMAGAIASADTKFEFINNSNLSINSIFIGHSEGSTMKWSNNFLHSGARLKSGGSMDMDFTGGTPCDATVSIRFDGSNEDVMWNKMNFCTTSKMTVFYDDKIKKYQATSE